MITDPRFNRLRLLLGDETLSQIMQKRVIVFGVGGVGSWCAESLVRSGICNITLVDADKVCITNINRQLLATTSTIDGVKVEVMKRRLLDINPSAQVTALEKRYNERYGIYTECCDVKVDASQDAILVAEKIIEEILK